MFDLTETIIDHLYNMPGAFALHIGEIVPQGTPYPFVWLMRSGENISDDLCHPATIDEVVIDLEVVSDDIDEARRWTAKTKDYLRSTALHLLTFETDAETTRTIHAFDVDDADDDYIPRNAGDDESLHVGALNVLAILGD